MQRNVLVVTGIGGIGIAIARRLGSGRHVILADYSDKALEAATSALQNDGFQVEGLKVDVSDYGSVTALAKRAVAAGNLEIIVHTAGVSPATATADKIYAVNLIGTANVIDVFDAVAVPGMSLTCVASLAGHYGEYSPDFLSHMATAPLSELGTHANFETNQADPNAGLTAYRIAKRANIIRAQAAALAYGAKGARINTISPGLIQTPMGRAEMVGTHADMLRISLQDSAAKRPGTAEDIARVAAFLAAPESSFITGSDFLIDGGQYSARMWHSTPSPPMGKL